MLIHLVSGKVMIDNFELNPGDEARISELNSFEIVALDDSEILMFDVSLEF